MQVATSYNWLRLGLVQTGLNCEGSVNVREDSVRDELHRQFSALWASSWSSLTAVHGLKLDEYDESDIHCTSLSPAPPASR